MECTFITQSCIIYSRIVFNFVLNSRIILSISKRNFAVEGWHQFTPWLEMGLSLSCVVFCRSLYVPLSLFFWPLFYLSSSDLRLLIIHWYLQYFLTTVKPVLRGHLWDKDKLSLYDRWPLNRGSIYMKYSMTRQLKGDLWYRWLLYRGNRIGRFYFIGETA